MDFLENFLMALKYTLALAIVIVCFLGPFVLTFVESVWGIFAYIITIPLGFTILFELED